MKRLILLLCVLAGFQAQATHLIGGNLGYEYIGQVGSNYRYRITLTTYTNCGPDSQIPTPEGPDLIIGVYGHDVQNNPTGGGDKTLINNVTISLVNQYVIEPNMPSNCSVGANTCIYKGIYEGIVDLPINFNGYHLFYERCCRNNSIVNLIQSESMAFHAYIPPPLLPNSSPQFTDDPIPFLCVGDSTSILNSAYDPDGDQLVFSFVHPYNGLADQNNPAPSPPQTLDWPIPEVVYEAGYNTSLPFGNGGYQSINASNGLTQYFPPATGDYVIAVEIKEYRNGNLIGITRRDLQLLVLNCPPNPAPNLTPSLGTVSTNFTVEEGETICFDYGFSDPNGDFVTLSANGVIFDANIVNPPATMNAPLSGNGSVATEFCWTTNCGQAQPLPYQFQVSVTDDGCPPKTTNEVYEITVEPVPPPSEILGDEVVCSNGLDTYSTTNIPNTTYNWSVTGGNIAANNGSSIDVVWTTQGTGSITLSATNQFGCTSAPIDKEITVVVAPTMNIGNDTTICGGTDANLYGSVSGTSPFTSTWSPSNSVTDPSAINTSATPTTTTTYYLNIDVGGCTLQDSMEVTVQAPTAEAGNDTTICSSETVNLNGSGAGGTILWDNSTSLNDATSLTPIASPNATTTYTLTITDGAGCIGQDSVIVTVDQDFVLDMTPDTSVCSGDCITISASGADNYAWFSSTAISDTSMASPQICISATEIFTVIGTQGVCLDTGTVQISNIDYPILNVPNDTSICFGDSLNLSVSGASNFTWSPSNQISNTSGGNVTIWPDSSVYYYLNGDNNNACISSDSILVTVLNAAAISAGPDKFICVSTSNGGSVASETLEGSSTGVFSWSPTLGLSDPNILNPIISPSTDTWYTITSTDASGCVSQDSVFVTVFSSVPVEAGDNETICEYDSIQLGGNPSSVGALTTYNWSPGGLVSDPSSPNPIAYPTATTMFYLTVTNDTCTGIDSVLITVSALPNISAGNDQNICMNDSTQVNVTGGSSYVWVPTNGISNDTSANPSFSPSDSTTYIVTGTDAQGCVSTDTININIWDLPTISISNDTSICEFDSIQLTASGGTSYLWTPDQDISNDSSNIATVFPVSTTTYFINVSDANSCSENDSVTITVNSLPNVSISGDTTFCQTDSASLQGNGAQNYTWSPSNGLSNTTVSNPNASPSSNSTYYVVGTDSNGCINNDSVTLTMLTGPQLAFTWSSTPGCEGLILELENQSQFATDYLWSISTGETSTEENPEVIVPYNSEYWVHLSANTNAGCITELGAVDTTLTFDEYYVIDSIPNVFTPNGDGINEEFIVTVGGKMYECLDIKIYNRWGQLIFKSFGYDNSWDGRTSVGKEVPEGVYFYTVEIKDYRYAGTINLFR